MTICIAIKIPCKELEHKKLPIKYNPGVIISADTRYLSANTEVADNGIKIWTLSKFTVAGFAGDVELAEKSLIGAKFAIEDLSLIRHEDISNIVQKWLLHYHNKLLKSRPDISPTEIVLSIYNTSTKRFYLYLLTNENDFTPQRRDGILAIGSGSNEIKKYLEKEIENHNAHLSKTDTGLKTVQTKGGLSVLPRTEDDMIELNLMDVSVIVTISLDELIKTSGLSSVGGLTQNYMLIESGVIPIHGKYSDDGGKTWKNGTARDLEGYADKKRRKYLIPRMNKDFNIVD